MKQRKYDITEFPLAFAPIKNYESFKKRLTPNTFTERVVVGDVVTFNYAHFGIRVFRNVYFCECRGITFNKKTGQLISRVIHKFFRPGENQLSTKEEYGKLQEEEEEILLDKLDGTMVVPFLYEGKLYFKTKRILFKDFLKRRNIEGFKISDNVKKFSIEQLKDGFVPIFEFISPNNPICVKYKYEDLVMIAIRELDTGNYIHPQEFEVITKKKIQSVKIVKKDHLKKKFIEGGVAMFYKTQRFFKRKTSWYKHNHKIFELSGKDVKRKDYYLKLLFNNELDEFKVDMDDEHLKEIIELEKKVKDVTNMILEKLKKIVEETKELTNKELASMIKDPFIKKQVFVLRNGKEINVKKLYLFKDNFLNI